MLGLKLLWLAVIHTAHVLGGGGPAPGAGYDMAARVAQFRSGADSAFFLNDDDPLAPSGIEMPAAPVTTTTATVTNITDLRANIVSGRHVTITPGTTITVTGERLFTIGNGLVDFRLTATGATLNITGNFHSYVTQEYCRRILIEGGTWNSIPQVAGMDIHFKGGSWIGDDNSSNPDANSSGLGVTGHRIAFEGVKWSGYNGLLFVAPFNAGQFNASTSGTTMTVDAMYSGTIRVGQYMQSFSGTAFPGGCVIEEQLTGTPGGVGTYRLSRTINRTGAFTLSYERSTNILQGNCEVIVNDLSDTPGVLITENPIRINSGHHIHTFDSRIYSENKYTGRFHPEWLGRFRVGCASLINCQIEGEGLQGVSGGGVYPHADHILLRGNRIYGGSDMGTGPLGLPRYGQINIASISGNGTTATATCSADAYHGLTTGDIIDDLLSEGGVFGGSGITVTVLNETQFTFPHAYNGTAAFGSCATRKVAITLVEMHNNESFTAPYFGTNGAGLLPTPNPNPAWSTCSSAGVSLAAGNAYRTFAGYPAWTKYTSTPTSHA